MRGLFTSLFIAVCAISCYGADLHAPAEAVAGQDLTLTSNASGGGTFYLVGPATAAKRSVSSAAEIAIDGEELQKAGLYTAILCASDGCNSATFFVHAAEPGRMSLLVHPSRVRVSEPSAISAVALVFDRFHNIVMTPQRVTFQVTSQDGKTISQAQTAKQGLAWIRLTSASKAGPAKVGASISDTVETRVVQQVASDACNLRIKSSWEKGKLLVETDPVRDCSGNFVPDGTVVSFTKVDGSGKTTVDAPIKKGTARTEMVVQGPARISVASGVVLGNELHVGGGR